MERQVLVKAKALWATRTVWANLLMAGLEIAQILLDFRVLPTQTLLIVMACANVLLRWVTKQPATVTGDTAKPVEAPPPKEPLGTPVR